MESTLNNKIKVAIATPGRFKPMGTFSRNYVQFLPFKTVLLFGGFIPYFYAGTSRNKQKILRYFYSLLSFKNQEKLNHLIKKRFKRILIKEKVDCVLSEFMNTGSAIREVCEELNIPIVSNVLGYEIHKKDVIEQNAREYTLLANYKSIVVPVAKNMIPKLKAYGFKDNQIIFSPLGARDEFFEITPNYKSKTFVAIGRFTESKSPQSTIRAFEKVLRKIPDAKLIMAGSGELLDKCQKLTEELKIQESIDFVGWITPAEQIELYKKSAVFVQHSVTSENGDAEGTPVAILEASAAGLPIISTIHGGIPDAVINNTTGFLVSENDWQLMATKMSEIIENPEKAEIMGQSGKKFIAENFSMMKHIETVTNAINLVVNIDKP